MTVSTSAYVRLRLQFIDNCEFASKEDLEKLKAYFKIRINSVRRLATLHNVEALISILEKRGALNAHNLICFKEIARIVNKAHLIHLTDDCEVEKPLHIKESNQTSTVLNILPTNAEGLIFEIITEQIGNGWKDLARNLRIGEGQIDELAKRYNLSPSKRVEEILLHHQRNCPEKWWYSLMSALTKSRRSDLHDKVQEIVERRN